MTRIKLFIEWYKLLTSRGYGRIMSIEYARYNSKYYTTDGKYR